MNIVGYDNKVMFSHLVKQAAGQGNYALNYDALPAPLASGASANDSAVKLAIIPTN